MTRLHLGMDPGIKNFGLATLVQVDQYKFEIVHKQTLDTGTYTSLEEFGAQLLTLARLNPPHTNSTLTIERFVPYNNVWSDIAEDVNNLIGMIRLSWYVENKLHPAKLVRAIEWKTALVRKLARETGFDNPSPKGELDKKFSLAAAKHIVINPEVITTDHEADAICLAAFPVLMGLS